MRGYKVELHLFVMLHTH